MEVELKVRLELIERNWKLNLDLFYFILFIYIYKDQNDRKLSLIWNKNTGEAKAKVGIKVAELRRN